MEPSAPVKPVRRLAFVATRPVAISAAPVSVAASMIRSAFRLRAAYETPSARTRRPSASVLFSSTVLPEWAS